MARTHKSVNRGEEIRIKIKKLCLFPRHEEELCKALEISRTAVRKHIQKMKLEVTKSPSGNLYQDNILHIKNSIPTEKILISKIKKFIRAKKKVPTPVEIMLLPEFRTIFLKDEEMRNKFYEHIELTINSYCFLNVEEKVIARIKE